MRSRNIKKDLWLNEKEKERLKQNAQKCGMDESNYLRSLITGYSPKEKPPKEFFDIIFELRHIGTNYNQISKRANELEYISYAEYNLNKQVINDLIKEIKEKYLYPDKNNK